MQASSQQQQVANNIVFALRIGIFRSESTVWQWEREQNFFEEMIRNQNITVLFKQYFRISKETFTNLCNLLQPVLQNTIRGDFIKFPRTREEAQNAINEFEQFSNIPQIVGVVDGSHISILAPTENKEDYFNRKHDYSVNLMGILNHKMMFLHASVGFPGSIHDSRAFQLTEVHNEIGDLLSQPTSEISGLNVRPQIIGDSAFPDRGWILKQYSNNLTPTERRFNRKLCSARVVVEQGFGLLKSRWRILFKKNEQNLSNVARTVTAAVVLHNFCLLNDDLFEEEVEVEVCSNQKKILNRTSKYSLLFTFFVYFPLVFS